MPGLARPGRTWADHEFRAPRGMIRYFEHRNEDADVGKYNGGQKLSMVPGTVTTSWARLHHTKWYREVTK